MLRLPPASSGLEQEHQQIGRGGMTSLLKPVADECHLLIREHAVLGVLQLELSWQFGHLVDVTTEVSISEHGPQC